MHDISLWLTVLAVVFFILDRRYRTRLFFYGCIGTVAGMVLVDFITAPVVTGVGLLIITIWCGIELIFALRSSYHEADELVRDTDTMPEPLRTRLIRFELTKRLNENHVHPAIRQQALRYLDKTFPEPKETD